jgi:hypothetical protein
MAAWNDIVDAFTRVLSDYHEHLLAAEQEKAAEKASEEKANCRKK